MILWRGSGAELPYRTLCAFPHILRSSFPFFAGPASQSLLLEEKPFRSHPSVSTDRPEALVSFFFHKSYCSKYEGKGPETNLDERSAGFQYGPSLAGFFPPLIINWHAQKELWPCFFLLMFAGTSAV